MDSAGGASDLRRDEAMAARRRISVEQSYRAWIDAMPELSLRQRATADQVLALARQIDVACAQEAGLGGIAVVSRELRQVATELRDIRGAGAPPGSEAAPAGSKADELRARREGRQNKRRARAAAIDEAVP